MNESKIIFKLKKIMDEKKMSKNHLCKLTGLRFETVQDTIKEIFQELIYMFYLYYAKLLIVG